ncbi:MAG: protein kinase [Gemmatimonadetes bacterium]|nr:protein kinase [Gemmatimonadota bacterium]
MREAEARALAESGLGSGLLARQASPTDVESIAVLKVCPQCGTEYETAARFCPSDGSALRPKGSDSLIGRVLADRYHILKRIGEGGMGRVYLGEHVKMNRQCAIKVMSPALVNDAESAARFAREASNAARIIHPNVAAVFDYGESEGLIYLVMEYVDGEPLSRLLAREAPLGLDRAIEITRQIADGLGAAHELGIIHRDLKPDNILITRTRAGKEVAKVVDFGIAKAMREGVEEGLTRTGQVIGTPEFMSPEQLLGDPVDARADLYALGCMFHMMLTAAPPFDAKTREQMIKRRLSEDVPHVHSLDPGIPESVAGIVARLLARSPEDRYGSAAELRDALAGTHLRRSHPPKLTLDKLTPRSAPTVAFLRVTQATTEMTEIPAAKVSRRAPYIIAGVALAAIGVAWAVQVAPSPISVEQKKALAQNVAADSARAVPPESLPPVAAVVPTDTAAKSNSLPVVLVDTVARNAKLLAQHRQDSVARLAMQEMNAVRAPLVKFAKAIESGDTASLRTAYPAMTVGQQVSWQTNFFARAENIETSIRYGATRIYGDSADAEFSLRLKINYKDSKSSGAIPLNQHARLTRVGDRWQIVALR